MSAYSFIAADYELPEVYNPKEKIITVKEAIELGIKAHEWMPWERMDPNAKILCFENESDLGEVVIRKTIIDDNIEWYTKKPFIYTVKFEYTNFRAEQLLEYLRDNTKEGHCLELWRIWLDDKQNIHPAVLDFKKLSVQHLKQMYDWNDENFVQHRGMIIKK